MAREYIIVYDANDNVLHHGQNNGNPLDYHRDGTEATYRSFKRESDGMRITNDVLRRKGHIFEKIDHNEFYLTAFDLSQINLHNSLMPL